MKRLKKRWDYVLLFWSPSELQGCWHFPESISDLALVVVWWSWPFVFSEHVRRCLWRVRSREERKESGEANGNIAVQTTFFSLCWIKSVTAWRKRHKTHANTHTHAHTHSHWKSCFANRENNYFESLRNSFQGGSSEMSMQTRKKSISICVFNYKSNDRVNHKGVLTRLS